MKIEEILNKVICGDCLEVMRDIPDNSIDSIVTDPPAGISFMGKSWDTDKGGRDNWIKWMQEVATECKRVLKPGGHAFVWAIPRTSHWTATAWENAGFEIRDVVAHVFGSGFPKSLNIGKKVDELQGNERVITGSEQKAKPTFHSQNVGGKITEIDNIQITKGNSEWEGWGTALKPAREDWILMRKPLDKGLTIAENCLKWGTGGINIDESRIRTEEKLGRPQASGSEINPFSKGLKSNGFNDYSDKIGGRFPANLVLEDCEEVRECFPETTVGARKAGQLRHTKDGDLNFTGDTYTVNDYPANSGNASRFFKSILYYPKASKSERNKGCEDIPEKRVNYMAKANGTGEPSMDTFSSMNRNNHPTVKPIALMEYLIKMVTPKGGIVLDPFAGSGSTLVAAKQNGFQYIGIELTEEYIPIIEARLNSPTQDKLL